MLFRNMDIEEVEACITALDAQIRKYNKGDLILLAGDSTNRLGVIMSGSVTIESNDIWGNCTILSHVGQKGFFAETYALLKDSVLLVDVRANENCQILFLSINKFANNSLAESPWSYKFLMNLLIISANKNLVLSGRSFHTSPKSVRGRIMSYLKSVSLQKHSNNFHIPFDRQQLADYLNVERTALSKELGKMAKEKIIEFRKNHFILLQI